jgi:hypothetical protein
MRTSDLNKAIEAVTRVFCPHRIEIADLGRTIDAVLKVAHPTSQPLVELYYGANRLSVKNLIGHAFLSSTKRPLIFGHVLAATGPRQNQHGSASHCQPLILPGW